MKWKSLASIKRKREAIRAGLRKLDNDIENDRVLKSLREKVEKRQTLLMNRSERRREEYLDTMRELEKAERALKSPRGMSEERMERARGYVNNWTTGVGWHSQPQAIWMNKAETMMLIHIRGGMTWAGRGEQRYAEVQYVLTRIIDEEKGWYANSHHSERKLQVSFTGRCQPGHIDYFVRFAIECGMPSHEIAEMVGMLPTNANVRNKILFEAGVIE